MLTDQDLLDDIQRLVIEPPDLGVTWPSGFWTAAEVLGYLNQRQDRFLKSTLLVTSWLMAPVTANQPQQNLPDGWLATRNAFFDTGTASSPLLEYSRQEADLMASTWESTPGPPSGYVSNEWATRQVLLIPTPIVSGWLHLFAALTGNPFDGTGIWVTIPDEFTPYLIYGVLADLYGKQGRAFDPQRRDYCESRFQEGIDTAQVLLSAVCVS
jgi:hypothetical protein